MNVDRVKNNRKHVVVEHLCAFVARTSHMGYIVSSNFERMCEQGPPQRAQLMTSYGLSRVFGSQGHHVRQVHL